MPSRKAKNHWQKHYHELPHLAKVANKYFQKSYRAWRGALKYAHKSGDALVAARRIFPMQRSRAWRKWLDDNFDASYETAKVYMRIARKWDDPRLVAARKHGLELNSIKAVLQVLTYQPLPDGKSRSKIPSKIEADMCRQELREKFAEALRTLSRYELLIFEEEFEYYWDKLSEKIYGDTCKVLGFDLDEYLLELGKQPKWTPKGRRAAYNIPKKVMDYEMRKMRVQERKAAKKEARRAVTKRSKKIR